MNSNRAKNNVKEIWASLRMGGLGLNATYKILAQIPLALGTGISIHYRRGHSLFGSTATGFPDVLSPSSAYSSCRSPESQPSHLGPVSNTSYPGTQIPTLPP